MTDVKTIMYSLAPDAAGSFTETSAKNALDSILFHDGGANWSADQASALLPASTTAINLLSLGGVSFGTTSSVWYFGKSEKFDTISFHFSTSTSNNSGRTVVYEYWDGATWVALPQSGVTTEVTAVNGSIAFINQQYYTIKLSSAIWSRWNTTLVNGVGPYYWLRIRILTQALTSASLATVSAYSSYERLSGYSKFDSVFTTLNDVAFTDVTEQAMSNQANSFTFDVSSTDARLYMGSDTNDIMGIVPQLSAAAGSTTVLAWEYWNGTAWVDIPFIAYAGPQTSVDHAPNLMATTYPTFIFNNILSDWASSSINSITKYWLRARVTATSAQAPVFNYLKPYKPISFSRTVWMPESTNRQVLSAYVKLSAYSNLTSTLRRIQAVARLGSAVFAPAEVGDSQVNVTGTFHHIGGRIFSTTANDGAFTNETGDASDSGAGDVGLTNAVDANVYFCYPNDPKWNQGYKILNIQSGSVFAGGTCAWEYWNGTAWTEFTPIFVNIDKDLNFRTTTPRSIIIPVIPDWAVTTVNSFTGYIFRRRITQVYSTGSSFTSILTSVPGFSSAEYLTSGENVELPIYVDVTNIFKAFAGTSETFDLKLAFNNTNLFMSGDINIAGELYITYAADDQTTRIKSVLIPLEANNNTALTNTLVAQGSNTLPDLATYLPEASKTIRNFYIVVTGLDGCLTPITTEYRIKVGSAAEKFSKGFTSGGVTANCLKLFYVDDSIATGAAQDVSLAVSSRLNSFTNYAMYAVVTYEYDADASTRVLNSLLLPVDAPSIYVPQDNPEYHDDLRAKFSIQEPGPITNARVGVIVSFSDPNQPSFGIRDYRDTDFTVINYPAASVTTGSYKYGAVLPAYTFDRGENTVGVDFYGIQAGTTPSCVSVAALFIVNYESDIHPDGPQVHNKTVSCRQNIQLGCATKHFEMTRLAAPLTGEYLNYIGFIGEFYSNTSTSAYFDAVYMLENSGLSSDRLRQVLGRSGVLEENESSSFFLVIGDKDVIKRFDGDLKANRLYELFDPNHRFVLDSGICNIIGGIATFITCHEIAHDVTGQVTGYSGDGSGLTVTFYSDATSELLFSTVTAVGGSFATTWHDDVADIVCDCYDPGLDRYAESSAGKAGIDTFAVDFGTPAARTYSNAYFA